MMQQYKEILALPAPAVQCGASPVWENGNCPLSCNGLKKKERKRNYKWQSTFCDKPKYISIYLDTFKKVFMICCKIAGIFFYLNIYLLYACMCKHINSSGSKVCRQE
jgi:hypothetical protein